jgi:hypothetical protein
MERPRLRLSAGQPRRGEAKPSQNRDGDRAQHAADPAAFEQRLSLLGAVRSGGHGSADLSAQKALPRIHAGAFQNSKNCWAISHPQPPTLKRHRQTEKPQTGENPGYLDSRGNTRHRKRVEGNRLRCLTAFPPSTSHPALVPTSSTFSLPCRLERSWAGGLHLGFARAGLPPAT